MYIQNPLVPTNYNNLYHLAPIPVYMKVFGDDELHDKVYTFGFENLTEQQKLMGQELPEQYDTERQSNYHVNYHRRDMWVEPTEYNPIGSRFWTPPNDFLDTDVPNVKTIRNRVERGYMDLLDMLGFQHNRKPNITESWIQYYNPTAGRGHNQHNHCRWSHDEETDLNFV